MRKGLEKLNGKTAEYQKWLKDRGAVGVPYGRLKGSQVEMLVSLDDFSEEGAEERFMTDSVSVCNMLLHQ